MSDFQSRAGDHGRKFHNAVKVHLLIEGWIILRENWRHPEVDIEVDIVARHPVLDQEWWIECKGSWEGNRPGLMRTDTVKKALLNGALLCLVDEPCPYMIIASHPPKDHSAGAIWLERAKGRYVDEVRYLGTITGCTPPTCHPTATSPGSTPAGHPSTATGGDRPTPLVGNGGR